jgi:hypothetical protein
LQHSPYLPQAAASPLPSPCNDSVSKLWAFSDNVKASKLRIAGWEKWLVNIQYWSENFRERPHGRSSCLCGKPLLNEFQRNKVWRWRLVWTGSG